MKIILIITFILILSSIIISLIIYFFRENYNNFIVKKSKISGDGLFSRIDINENSYLFKSFDRNKNMTDISRKINHCNNPNTILIKKGDEWEIHSIKNIKKGDEITCDYNNTPSFIKKPDKNWTC